MPTAWWGVRPDLAVGCYDVKVTFQDSNDKPSRWLMGLEIREDETREETVEFSSGTVVVNAQMQDGDALANFQASIYYYCTGDHQQPVAFVPAGEPAVLAERRYDVRASFVRSHDRPDLWRRDLVVKAGQVLQETIGFPQDVTHHHRPQRLKW